jgi:hypothetical protein
MNAPDPGFQYQMIFDEIRAASTRLAWLAKGTECFNPETDSFDPAPSPSNRITNGSHAAFDEIDCQISRGSKGQ